jgi:tripartite-type tricarboxylate transporter receptor subunit TctC
VPLTRRPVLGLALGAFVGVQARTSTAAEARERRVRFLVPFAAGGAGDIAARVIADDFSSREQWPTVVDNKPGATGIVGAQAAFHGPPDGSMLFLGHSDTIVLNPLTHKSLAYDAAKFEPVAFLSRVPGVLLARPETGIDSGAALIKAARSRPGQVSYASWGLGSSVHLGMEWIQQVGGIELLHVPFQSTVASIQGLLAGEVDLAWATPEFALQAAAQRKALMVGASSATRLARAPNVVPLAEQGFPGVDLDTWYGLFAPPGTPSAAISEIHRAANAALADPETAARLRKAGHEIASMSIPEFAAFVEADRARWRRLIETRHLAFDLR